MAVQKWIKSTRGASGFITILTTELDSLANDAGIVTGEIANDTELDMYADVGLVFQHGSAPTADRTHDLYLVRQIDGTNYEDASATRPPANGSAGAFVCDAVTTQQRKIIPGVLVPPGKFKMLLVNKSGQAMSASGNTLRAVFYNQQVV